MILNYKLPMELFLLYTIHVYQKKLFFMLAVRLPENIEKRLGNLAEKTGRTKTFYVRQAILQHLDDIEDYYLAVDRLKNDDVIFSQEEVEKELGISN